MPKLVEQSGFWVAGINSRDDPAYIGKSNYAWSFNTLNRGGIIRTRPGFAELCPPPVLSVLIDDNPQGITFFTPISGIPYLVIAHGGLIYISAFPFTSFGGLLHVHFASHVPITFVTALKTAITNDDGTLSFVPQPYPVLMMQDGLSRAAYWDGTVARHLDPTPTNLAHETPIGTAMAWSGSRLWVGNGRRLRASNLGDPLKFTEEDITAEGGFFTLPDELTGIGQTPDLRSLLVFTNSTTTTFQSSIFDRTLWRVTPDFQKVLFQEIGCCSHKSIINQYGITWWYSHNGLIALDAALQTYRSSRIHYRDQAMMRSKAFLSPNLSGVCIGQFENILMISVPSGDRFNRHTWILDQTILDSFEGSEVEQPAWASAWKGIRPVEWATAIINGEKRCFCLSRDYVPGGKPKQYKLGIWEVFVNQRLDSQADGTVKRITCGWESRMLAFSAEPKKISFIELDIAEIVGKVNIRVFYAGRRSQYRLIASKQVVGSMGPMGGPTTVALTATTPVGSYHPQVRVIRTPEIRDAKAKAGVQSRAIKNVDRGFSIYVEWDGQMALMNCRIFCEAKSSEEAAIGECRPDDTTARYVDANGDEFLTTQPIAPDTRQFNQSQFVTSLNQKNIEPAYSSR